MHFHRSAIDTTKFKVSIIGCGNVGATIAYSLLTDGTPTDLALVDIDENKAHGLYLDFSHALSFFPNTKISAAGNYDICADSNLVIVTAGARQEKGETRLDLIQKNRQIFRQIIPQITAAAPNAILLIVTNPVDVLTYEALKISGFPPNRVFGSGTMLDTARLRFHISEKLSLSPTSIQAFVLGEHGDSSFPVFSSANVAGKSLFDFDCFTPEVAEHCYQETKNAAYKIINDLGYTCYSIAMVTKSIMNHLFQNSQAVLPLSVYLDGEYGYQDVTLSVPCVLNQNGISRILEVPLSDQEKTKFAHSVKTIKSYL